MISNRPSSDKLPRPSIIPEGEDLIAVLHEHPIVMAQAFVIAIPLLGIGIWLAILGEDWRLWGLALATFAMVIIAVRVVKWRLAPVYYITDRQATIKSSIIGSDFSSIIFSDVKGKDYKRGLLGQIFGYGDVILTGREKKLELKNIPLRPAKALRIFQELADQSRDRLRGQHKSENT
jgi:uncharacterized membrane protein YdbT with pleckstrin-like domain